MSSRVEPLAGSSITSCVALRKYCSNAGPRLSRKIAVELMEDGEHLVDDERLLLRLRDVILEHVEPEGPREVRRVEVDNVVIALRRHLLREYRGCRCRAGQ